MIRTGSGGRHLRGALSAHSDQWAPASLPSNLPPCRALTTVLALLIGKCRLKPAPTRQRSGWHHAGIAPTLTLTLRFSTLLRQRLPRPKPRCHGELSGTKRCGATAYDDLTRWIPQLQQPPVTSTTSITVKDSKACNAVYPSWTPLRPPKNLQMSLSTS